MLESYYIDIYICVLLGYNAAQLSDATRIGCDGNEINGVTGGGGGGATNERSAPLGRRGSEERSGGAWPVAPPRG